LTDEKLCGNDGVPYKYKSASHYRTLCDALKCEMRTILKTNGLLELKVPLNSEDPSDVHIFVSSSILAFTKHRPDNIDKVLILVHGSGDVTAGQWSPRYNLLQVFQM
jgi:hypothetical protein